MPGHGSKAVGGGGKVEWRKEGRNGGEGRKREGGGGGG